MITFITRNANADAPHLVDAYTAISLKTFFEADTQKLSSTIVKVEATAGELLLEKKKPIKEQFIIYFFPCLYLDSHHTYNFILIYMCVVVVLSFQYAT